MYHTDEKTGLRGGVDVNGVPTGMEWRVIRRFFEEGGAALGETTTYVPFTSEELATHLSAALVAQAANIEADRLARDALTAELAAVKSERDALAAQLASAPT
jgi:hypothetical protein